MGMVTLMQQTLDGNHQCPKEQDVNGAVVSAESHAVDRFRGEAARSSARETAVVAPGNGSVGDSSTQCSDVDEDDNDDEEEETDIEEGGSWITSLPVSSTVIQQHQAVATTNGDVVLPNADPSNFGDVCVKNSTNVHLGNKTFYKGPVTIKQFVYTNPIPIQDADKLDTSPVSDVKISDLPTSKDDGVSNKPIFSQNAELNKVMQWFWMWRLLYAVLSCVLALTLLELLMITTACFTYHPDAQVFPEILNSSVEVTQWLWTWRCAALSCVLALTLLTVVVITTAYFTRHPDAPVFPEIPDSSVGGVIGKSVRFVERNEWGAEPPSEPLTKMKLPVPYVIISHTATEPCVTQSDCTLRVRFAQTFHIESRKWSDIAYNFLVGGDGLAYVGRSWDYVGAHSFGFNTNSIGISFIGTFNKVVPPKIQLHAAQKVIEIGVKNGKIAPDYKLLGHRQVSKTLSPGSALYNEIKTWPHWSPEP